MFVLDGCTDGTPDRLARCGRRPRPAAPRREPRAEPRQGVRRPRPGCSPPAGRSASSPTSTSLTDSTTLPASPTRCGPGRRSPSPPASTRRARSSAGRGCSGYAYRRRLQSRLFGAVARLLLPLAQRDTQAGLKGMTAAVAERVLPDLRCDGFGFDCELLTACARLGIPVAEVPVCVRYDDAASTTGGAGRRCGWRPRPVADPPGVADGPAVPVPAADPVPARRDQVARAADLTRVGDRARREARRRDRRRPPATCSSPPTTSASARTRPAASSTSRPAARSRPPSCWSTRRSPPRRSRMWRKAGGRLELGWHPCLTLDAPGACRRTRCRRWSMPTAGSCRWPVPAAAGCAGGSTAAEVEAELRAQFRRFVELVGDRRRT